MHLHVYFATLYKKYGFGQNLFCIIYNSNTKFYFAYFCIFDESGHINACFHDFFVLMLFFLIFIFSGQSRLNYVVQLSESVHHNTTKLNSEQSQVYFKVTFKVDSDSGRVFFLDAPGETGKTFLMNLLLASVRMHKKMRFL